MPFVYTGLMVMFFDDFENAYLAENEPFEKVSYGDAVFTLVKKETLIDELNTRNGSKYLPLIYELEKVSNSCLIALDG